MYSPLQELWEPCPLHSKVVFTQCRGVLTALILPLHFSFPHTLQPSPSHTPQLRHFFVSNELHFGVYALMAISPGEEVTLPFDFRYDKWCAQHDSTHPNKQLKHPFSPPPLFPFLSSPSSPSLTLSFLSPPPFPPSLPHSHTWSQ